MRRTTWWIILLFMLVTSLAGLWNGPPDWNQSPQLTRRAVAASVITYGVAGLVAFFAMLAKRKWVMVPMIFWAIGCAFAATFAPIVYGLEETGWGGVALSSVSAIALVSLITIQVKKEKRRWSSQVEKKL